MNSPQPNLHEQLVSLARKLQNPLSTIQELNNALDHNPNFLNYKEPAKTLIEQSKEIVYLVEIITKKYFNQTNTQDLPLIFNLYTTVPSIKACCTKQPDSSLIAKTDLEWLVKLENVVFQQINKRKINLIDIAYELAVSERQLHRNTKNFLGLTPNNYIRILKLYQAKEYLENYTFRTIAEVSHAVGFTDTHYFTKIFQNQYGVSPKTLRPSE